MLLALQIHKIMPKDGGLTKIFVCSGKICYNKAMDTKILPKKCIGGRIGVPGDKSISHRALILGAIGEGMTEISGFLGGEDCLATINCLTRLGTEVEWHGDVVRVAGRGLHGLTAPKDVLYVGNSGTTLRLLTGLLAGQNFNSVLDGDASIRRRPMDRVVSPLTLMGAKVKGNFAPIEVMGTKLRGICYKMPINSAQVKSAILLAGLYAAGNTLVEELAHGLTRDHTEIMMKYMGADLDVCDNKIACNGGVIHGRKIVVPGDFSSAAFFIGAAALLAENGLTIENVGINPTRTGFLDAMAAMGAHIEIKNRRKLCGEDIGDIFVKKSKLPLKAIRLAGDIIPRMIDEVPILAVVALFAEGITVIAGAEELAVKESNRIKAMACELGKMGAKIEEKADGMIIQGGLVLRGAVVDSHNDHRVAMALAIAGLMAKGETVIQNAQCADISFPGFFKILADV